MDIIRKNTKTGKEPEIHKEGELVYLTFPALTETGIVRHLFSTRLGGVSRGHLGSMNLSDTRGDDKEKVDENFRRIAKALGKDRADFVCTDQTHTANVRVVTRKDRGKGITRQRDYSDVDGLVTDEPGIVLSAFFADCVPLFFVDPVRRVIGLSHSGWKGTVQKIGKVTVEVMTEKFGSRPEDIVAAIGPSICGSCYEVSGDVAGQFRETFADYMQRNSCGNWADGAEKEEWILREKGGGKYLLNLWEANRQVMREAKIAQENISITDICTCCNPDFLFSHRASQGKRGNLGAFLMLEEA